MRASSLFVLTFAFPGTNPLIACSGSPDRSTGKDGTPPDVGDTPGDGDAGQNGEIPDDGDATGDGDDAANGSGGTSNEDPSEASCSVVSPCGGDFEGSFVVHSSCLTVGGMLNVSGLGIGCQRAPIVGELSISGELTATSTGALEDNTRTTGTVALELPDTCRSTDAPMLLTCDAMGPPLTYVGLSEGACTEVAETGGCQCTGTVDQPGGLGHVRNPHLRLTTHETTGNVLTLSDPEERFLSNTYDFCRRGDTIELTPTDSPLGAIEGSILLIPQR